ncbi:hypothetical protein FQZ97_817710 [compost metagenome]
MQGAAPIAHRQGQAARVGQAFALGHQGTDLVGRDGGGQVPHQLVQQQLLQGGEGGGGWRAVEREVVHQAGLRVCMDHAEELAEAVALAQPFQARRAVGAVDDHRLAGGGADQVDGDVLVADRLPVVEVVRRQVEQVRAVLFRHTVDHRGAAPPGLVEGQQLLQSRQRQRVEAFDGPVPGQALEFQHGVAERLQQGGGDRAISLVAHAVSPGATLLLFCHGFG